MDSRRYSYDGSLRPDVAALPSASRTSYDSGASGRPSLDAACPPRRVSFDHTAVTTHDCSDPTVQYFQVKAAVCLTSPLLRFSAAVMTIFPIPF